MTSGAMMGTTLAKDGYPNARAVYNAVAHDAGKIKHWYSENA